MAPVCQTAPEGILGDVTGRMCTEDIMDQKRVSYWKDGLFERMRAMIAKNRPCDRVLFRYE
jgi:hypothetical protein